MSKLIWITGANKAIIIDYYIQYWTDYSYQIYVVVLWQLECTFIILYIQALHLK